MLVITIAAGAVLGMVSGLIYVTLRIPPIITSLGVTLIYEGVMYTLTSGQYVMTEVQNSSMSGFVGPWLYAAIIIAVVLVLSILLFDYTCLLYTSSYCYLIGWSLSRTRFHNVYLPPRVATFRQAND